MTKLPWQEFQLRAWFVGFVSPSYYDSFMVKECWIHMNSYFEEFKWSIIALHYLAFSSQNLGKDESREFSSLTYFPLISSWSPNEAGLNI